MDLGTVIVSVLDRIETELCVANVVGLGLFYFFYFFILKTFFLLWVGVARPVPYVSVHSTSQILDWG